MTDRSETSALSQNDKVAVRLWADSFESYDGGPFAKAFNEELHKRGIDKKDVWIAFKDHPQSQFNDRFGAYLLEIALTVPASVVGSIVYDLLKHSFMKLMNEHFLHSSEAELVKSIKDAQRKQASKAGRVKRVRRRGVKAARKK